MTQEEKILLAKDICARTPYGLICRNEIKNCDVRVDCTRCTSHSFQEYAVFGYDRLHQYNGEELRYIKPYLRKLSSMTEEEKKEERKLWDIITKTRNDLHYIYTDFLLSHHFDYRGLIPMGLALEAPEGMYENVSQNT